MSGWRIRPSITSILRCHGAGPDGRALADTLHFVGGMGARSTKDGIACMSFPGAGSETPVEMMENSLPITVLRKQLVADTARSVWTE